MLPAETPLSLARCLAPAPPAMAQECRTALAAHSGRVATPMTGEARPAKPAPHPEPTLMLAHDQTGNAAVAAAAAQARPPLPLVPAAGRPADM